jgi:hypothetical protein
MDRACQCSLCSALPSLAGLNPCGLAWRWVGMKAVALINSANAQRVDCDQALRAAGIDASIDRIAGDRIAARAKAAVGDGAAVVIVGGADGSVSAAAGAVAGSNAALGILPLGTLNHFARDLGICSIWTKRKAIAKDPARSIDLPAPLVFRIRPKALKVMVQHVSGKSRRSKRRA